MSEFSDRPLVAGSIIGVRSFKVDKWGRLTGVSQSGQVWRPGENHAVCVHNVLRTESEAEYEMRKMQHSFSVSFTVPPRYRPSHPELKRKPVCLTKHRVGCETVEVTARPKLNKWRVVWGAAAGAAYGAAGVVAFSDWLLALTYFATGLNCTFAAFTAKPKAQPPRRERLRMPRSSGGCVWDAGPSKVDAAVRRNYPDVPVYDSLDAAVADFPLLAPAPLSPDNDPTFWTRPVSV